MPASARNQILHELVTRDFVGLEREVAALGHDELLRVPQLRGGVEVLDAVPEAQSLRDVYDLLPPEVADARDLRPRADPLARLLHGAVFEVYDAAFGSPIGGGGRYDDLLGRFGRDLPACGWAMNVERLHLARVGEGR